MVVMMVVAAAVGGGIGKRERVKTSGKCVS